MASRGEANETAELFDRVWRNDQYAGFSRGTLGAARTPLLDAFIARVKTLDVSPKRVVELGAGSCDHALRCTREGLETTAVEYSSSAVAAARQRFADSPLTIVHADLFAFTRELAMSSLAGVYANSVFHFLTPEERRGQYRLLRTALIPGGAVAISFKGRGDALEKRGRVVERTLAGPVVEGDDGIRRLFVADSDPLGNEMRDEGLSVVDVFCWSVSDYNIAREDGEFVGLLAIRSER